MAGWDGTVVEPTAGEPERVLPPCVVFDLDGTLALLGERSPYDASRCEEDAPFAAVHFVHEAIRRAFPEVAVVIVSGREERFRPQTERWLARHGIAPTALYLRRTGDRRRDVAVKREIWRAHLRGRFEVKVVFEDRDQVVRLWRDELGLPCFQVAWGDF